MKRIAVIGGGIAGLTAAYELEQQRKAGAGVEWTLYEAGGRLGGIVETTRRDGFVLEGGPDGWVSEKPWARELAIELGLESQLIYSNDATRKTYVLLEGKLRAMPGHMQMMVPQDLAALNGSGLFSASARAAYARELERAEELRASAPIQDESVASFVRRHFGEEVLAKIVAPLLSGVFGGDVERLSVQAVMPAFVAMEREHGSLIEAVREKARERAGKPPQPIFTSLRDGVGRLVDVLAAALPAKSLQLNSPVTAFRREDAGWLVSTALAAEMFDAVLLAAPADAARALLLGVDAEAAALLPTEASSAVLTAFAWRAEDAKGWTIPQGFGFLVPQAGVRREGPHIFACTFVDQKFPHRVPVGGRILRVFYGGDSCEMIKALSDEDVSTLALEDLSRIFGPIPVPEAELTTVRRWPRSLPQYELGHLERMAALDLRARALGGLHLLGNAYRGVGLPDLIRDARAAARSVAAATFE